MYYYTQLIIYKNVSICLMHFSTMHFDICNKRLTEKKAKHVAIEL